MTELRAVIIGCGKSTRTAGAKEHGISHCHVQGYQATEGCKVTACADIVEEYAASYAALYGLPKYYLDYREMIAAEKPDIVSVCTWPHLHAEMVIHCAKAGVRAIHCEKPMAPTFGEARRMKETCDELGVQLTFNHQRRFEPQYRTVRELANRGVVGKVLRIEAACGDMFDWGTHWFDMINFYNNDVPAEWIIGQVDSRTDNKVFGVPIENQGIASFRYANGVYGFFVSGYGATIWAEHRILGTDGIIEAHMPVVKVRGKGDTEMRTITFPEQKNIGAWSAITFGIWDLVHGLRTGREPELSARKALAGTQLIFGAYESSRRRARVEFPLDIDDNPLHSMMASGEIGPGRSEHANVKK
ncbi:MAG TPA: Gfo/Idh/MocA family oxidoreductase [Candidatus Latescibacteria bacterium]|nr:Gfo/Idh/MocA family oxidoreductase [Candidatus Latescibacterota bacterium]